MKYGLKEFKGQLEQPMTIEAYPLLLDTLLKDIPKEIVEIVGLNCLTFSLGNSLIKTEKGYSFNDGDYLVIYSYSELYKRYVVWDKETFEKVWIPIDNFIAKNKYTQIIKTRGKGKTTDLIILSSNQKIPILVSTKQQKDYIYKKAVKLHYEIPEPVTLDELKKGYLRGTGVKKVLIDELDYFCEDLISYYGLGLEGYTLTKI